MLSFENKHKKWINDSMATIFISIIKLKAVCAFEIVNTFDSHSRDRGRITAVKWSDIARWDE